MKGEKIPELKAFEAKSSLEHVYSEMKNAIMMGEFPPGKKIRINEYAEVFGTSHMPVREALNQLVIVGALDSQPRRSNAIPLFSERRLRELMDLRLAIEGRAVELAAEKCTPADIRALRQLQERMQGLLDAEPFSLRAYLKLNHQLHLRLYRISDNDQLVGMIELAWLRYGPMLNLLGRGPKSATLLEGNEEHRRMIDALEARDAGAARAALLNDLSGAADSILKASQPTA